MDPEAPLSKKVLRERERERERVSLSPRAGGGWDVSRPAAWSHLRIYRKCKKCYEERRLFPYPRVWRMTSVVMRRNSMIFLSHNARNAYTLAVWSMTLVVMRKKSWSRVFSQSQCKNGIYATPRAQHDVSAGRVCV
jgi:hypothetical protein